jgi:outer membrane protein assembly factor BamE (lipoprotein component of BamABCDE complex)
LLGLACSLALSGCIPVPILSGPRKDSRTNLPEAAPPWIVTGRTTRRDVLLGLGDPDGKASDDRWFTYGSAISHGGVAGVTAGPGGGGFIGRESVEYRRLIVRFDDNGVVSSVDWQKKRCAEYPQGTDSSGYVTTVPCVDIQGNDLASGATAAAETTTGDIIAQYDNASWWTYSAGERPCTDHHISVWEPLSIGRMEITRNSLILVKPPRQKVGLSVIQKPVLVTLPLSEINSVIPPSRPGVVLGHYKERSMIVEQKNGSCLYVALEGLSLRGGETKTASELLQRAVAMATDHGIPPAEPR